MNVPHLRDKARVEARMNKHTLGRFIWNPPAETAYRRAPADQQGLAICKNCEATVSTRGQEMWGTALTHECPFTYTPDMLAAIDAADPVEEP